ncbi:MAG: excinuclease ABC subunit UvrA, partial [Deltaproteobacteria bacterium]|nr:excinuclease ABC subunit UvrA [Deltaproteobacteria bacterium]
MHQNRGDGGEKMKQKAHIIPLPPTPHLRIEKDELIIEGARQNNLKGINLRLPHNRITVIVGLSGSGKSTLAFDTIFAEGRWRFIESLSTYTRLFLERMDRPDVDRMGNIRPAIALEQKNPVRTARSTVGTATEVYDYYRLLFAKIGRTFCSRCGQEIRPDYPTSIAERLLDGEEGGKALLGFIMPIPKGVSGEEIREDLLRRGFIRLRIGERVWELEVEEPDLEGVKEAMVIVDRLVIRPSERARLVEALEVAYREGEGVIWVEVPGKGVRRFTRGFKCLKCSIEFERPTPILFSFNHPIGACPECKGFGNVLRYDEDKIVPDPSLSLRDGAIVPWTKPAYRWWYEELEDFAQREGIDLDKPFSRLSKKEKEIIFKGSGYYEGIEGFFNYLETKRYKLHIRVFLHRYKGQFLCPTCHGARLKKEALYVKVGGLNIYEIARMTIEEARGFFDTLKLTPYEMDVASEVLRQIRTRLDLLYDIGLGYITLDRQTRTLSGGEAQRVNIANQLGSHLSGVLYVLDEPSIGLHPRDIDRLIHTLKGLTKRGNTLVVVEHDPSVIRSADYIVELGPGAGERGGRVVFAGPISEFIERAKTLTSRYIKGDETIPVPRWRRKGSGKALVLKGARGNNLKDIDIKIPLRTFACITGVSGSGKSSLIQDTLYNVLARAFRLPFERPLAYKELQGLEYLEGVKLIDQEPIGRTPRSNPITYIGGFDEIRKFFAGLPASRRLGLTPGHFSFNVSGGRCDVCRGEGVEKLE